MRPPYVPGGALAGVVAATGPGVDPGWIGRRVATPTATSGIGGGSPTGAYAELARAKAETLVEVPAEVNLGQAAALVSDGRTAIAVADRAKFRPGDRVLITAAAGGLGTLLIQLARAAGAEVIAAARGEAKLALAQRLGAQHVVDYSEPGWVDRVRALSDGGVQIVLDGAGGAIGAATLAATARGGVILGYGNAAGGFAPFDPEAVAAQGVTVVSLFDIADPAADWKSMQEQALREVAAGRLEVVIGQSFPLGEARSAHEAIAARTALGRTILTV